MTTAFFLFRMANNNRGMGYWTFTYNFLDEWERDRKKWWNIAEWWRSTSLWGVTGRRYKSSVRLGGSGDELSTWQWQFLWLVILSEKPSLWALKSQGRSPRRQHPYCETTTHPSIHLSVDDDTYITRRSRHSKDNYMLYIIPLCSAAVILIYLIHSLITITFNRQLSANSHKPPLRQLSAWFVLR